MEPQKPHIRDYLNIPEYLNAVYAWRKASDHRFSYSVWASELKMKSKSHLRMILAKKRQLAVQYVPLFQKGLKLGRLDAQYFEKLVQFSCSKSEVERQGLHVELKKLSIAKENSTAIVTDTKSFLSSIAPKLHVLIADPQVERTIPAMAKALDVKVSEVRESLERMEAMGLAERREAKRGIVYWRSKAELFDVPDTSDFESLKQFHRTRLEEATRAIELPRETRKFHSGFFVLTESEYTEMVVELQEFFQSMLTRFTEGREGKHRVYQLNTNLIPTSEVFVRTAENEKMIS